MLLNVSYLGEREKQDRWPDFLPELLQAFNTVHSTIGFAPSYLMFGWTVRIPVDLELGLVVDQQKWGLRGWVQDHHKLKCAYTVARSKMDKAAEVMKAMITRLRMHPFYSSWSAGLGQGSKWARMWGNCLVFGIQCPMS